MNRFISDTNSKTQSNDSNPIHISDPSTKNESHDSKLIRNEFRAQFSASFKMLQESYNENE